MQPSEESLFLTADSTYAGGTTISAGTLQLGGGGASGSITGDVTDNGTLAFDRSDIYTFGGLISGSGAVSQIGGGTTILTTNNSYTGGTTISAGALQLGDGGIGGGIVGDVTNNAALIFNRSNALGFGGMISGTGSVSQIGAGTTTLAGVNGYSGGTTISAGTLRGSATSFGPGAILDNAALVIDQPADADFANAINGTGSFTKLGAGRLNYTGTGGLTGATTVAAGTLAVNGSLAGSAVTVQNGGTLGGNGTVGATTAQSGGAIAPGNSIGTLHINGPFAQNAGSTYQVEVDPNTDASDRIAVTGAAALQSGAGLNVIKYVSGDYRVGTVYTVLTSTGGLAGTYTLSGQTVSAFLALKDTYDANNAYLTVVQTLDPVQVAETPNQQQVAPNIPDPIETPILNLPSIPAAQSAFDQLSGQILASAKSALVAHALYVRDATFDRLRDSYCDEDRRERPRPGCSWDGPSLWGQGYGGWGGVSGNGNATGLNHATAGFLLGVDVPVAGWRAGVFGGRSRSDLQLVRTDAAAESTEFHLGAYAGTRWDDISLRLGASYSWDSITANRTIAFGTFRDALRAVYNVGAAQGFAELGYRMEMWETTFEPFANLAYVNVRTGGFSEVGGPAALTVRADTVENLITTFGVRPSTDVIVDGAELTLRGLAGWRHTFGSIAPGSTVAFAGGNDFTITGAPLARDTMALEAGMDFTVRDNGPVPMKQGAYPVRVERDAMVKMRDGVRLATDLYFPEGKGSARIGGRGTVLLRTPYDKSRYRPENSGRVASMLASHGFAVAIQDVRGKYQSEGDFGVSKQDNIDGYDTIDWLSKQPWSNSKVAMFGCSSDGEAQIMTAPLKHPALVALVPRGAGGAVGKAGGRYRFFGAWNGGALELGQSAKWFPVHGGRGARDLKVDLARATKTLPIIDLMSGAGASQASALWKEFISREMDSPVFDQLGYLNNGDTVSSAALHVNSWFDYGVADTLFTFNYFREHAANERAAKGQYLVISPTGHCGSEFAGAPYRIGELELDDPRIDLWALYLKWFRYWLNGEKTALRGVPKVQYYLMGKNEWRSANAWPVPGTKFEKFYLDGNGLANSLEGDGQLALERPRSSATDQFLYDPASPVPTVGGQSAVAGAGAVDQRAVEQRKDVLVYTSDVLTDTRDVVGPLEASLYVSSSARDTDFTVKLVDVFPDGTALNIQEGVIRARYREGMDKKVWMRPGVVYPVTINLQATAYSFARGHRIRIEVSSSNFPRFDRNLNTGGSNIDETEWQTATNAVHHSPEYPSHIVLPILRAP